VQIDDEDHAWASLRSWRLWRKAQSERWIAVCDEAAKGRRYASGCTARSPSACGRTEGGFHASWSAEGTAIIWT